MPGELEDLTGPNSYAEKLWGGFGAVEGPVFSRLGYLLFSDTAAARIMKWEQGTVTVFRDNTSAFGLTFDHQGRLLACERNCVTRTERNGEVTVLAGRLRAAHDVVYAIDGSIYFTDASSAGGAVYQITGRGEVRAVARDCGVPSGVALAPNQQKLFVSDIEGRRIRVYEIAADGSLKTGRTFVQSLARGLKTDEKGNVWAAADHAIAVFDSEGKPHGEIALPEDPTNCGWGDGFSSLYVTAGQSVYRIGTKVDGTRTY
jgi:gluconolactonase